MDAVHIERGRDGAFERDRHGKECWLIHLRWRLIHAARRLSMDLGE